MQEKEGVRENSNTSNEPFDSFGGSGFHGSMFPSIFGGKDPFDDPFFNHSFGTNMFSFSEPGNFHNESRSKQPVIEELESDAEGTPEDKKESDAPHTAWSNRNPLIEHPEDQAKDHEKGDNFNRREISCTANHNKGGVTQPRSQSVSFQRVTYGGINGAYYSATTSREARSDGVTMEECRQADRTTGQATHRISRGIRDKGHSFTRKLGSDGKVDTMQTLHNLNEDEVTGFEQAWSVNAGRNLQDQTAFPTDSGTLGAWGEFSDPFGGHSNKNGDRGRKPKKVVTVYIE